MNRPVDHSRRGEAAGDRVLWKERRITHQRKQGIHLVMVISFEMPINITQKEQKRTYNSAKTHCVYKVT